MTHANQEAREAGRAGQGNGQVGLKPTGGRGVRRTSRPSALAAIRLKRSVELFPASDGSLYLLRLGAGDDLVIEQPTSAERLLLTRLGEGFATPAELKTLLAAAGAGTLDLSLAELEGAGVLERRGRASLDGEAAERYDRQLIYLADLVGPGQQAEELQARLAQATVVLVGCGGLGTWTACGLSCVGVGTLVLIDDDLVELSNLNRQLLFRHDQIGEPKVEAAAAALTAHNPALQVEALRRRIRSADDLARVLAGRPNLVVATADWPPHDLPRWVNQACLGAGVPWIGAGQFPPRLRVGPMVLPGRSACYECLEEAARGESEIYDQVASWRNRRCTVDASVGPVSGVIGSLLASEALHLLLGVFEPRSVGNSLVLDLATMAFRVEAIPRRPGCPACGGLFSAVGPRLRVPALGLI